MRVSFGSTPLSLINSCKASDFAFSISGSVLLFFEEEAGAAETSPIWQSLLLELLREDELEDCFLFFLFFFRFFAFSLELLLASLSLELCFRLEGDRERSRSRPRPAPPASASRTAREPA